MVPDSILQRILWLTDWDDLVIIQRIQLIQG